MELSELTAIRKNLDVFLTRFDDCIQTRPSRGHLRTYLGGQVGDLPRKSIEPIALEAGVPVRSLQEFLGLHRWDHDAVRRRVSQIVAREHGDPEAIAVIDETSFPKKGTHTAGVQRQYCGATGKTDNCVVTVHLGYTTEDFHALVDGDLYLPRESWAQDGPRRRKAGIPETVVFRPKWRIALDLLERTLAEGVPFKHLTADEEYGRCGEFRRTVAAHGLLYVVEIPCALVGWTDPPPMVGPEDYSGKGPRRRRRRLAPKAPAPQAVKDVWAKAGPRWKTFHVKNTDKGPVVWKARARRFRLWEDKGAGEEGWLIQARNVVDGEVKYFFSNAPADTPLAELLRIAFSRWVIERLFEDGKGAVGMSHFEVRRYLPMIRHLILSMVSLLFLMKETNRLRGKKSLVECVPGQRGPERAA